MEMRTGETELLQEIEESLQDIPVERRVPLVIQLASMLVENAAYDSAGTIRTTTVSRMICLAHELSQVSETLQLSAVKIKEN